MPADHAQALSWFRRDLNPGDAGPDVSVVQRRLGLEQTGVFDIATERRVRGLQRRSGLPVTGKVDGATAHKVGDRARAGKAPGWFVHDLRLGDHGEDVYALTVVLGITPDSRFTPEVESAVRRVQSARGDAVTGMVTEAFASAIVQD